MDNGRLLAFEKCFCCDRLYYFVTVVQQEGRDDAYVTVPVTSKYQAHRAIDLLFQMRRLTEQEFEHFSRQISESLLPILPLQGRKRYRVERVHDTEKYQCAIARRVAHLALLDTHDLRVVG